MNDTQLMSENGPSIYCTRCLRVEHIVTAATCTVTTGKRGTGISHCAAASYNPASRVAVSSRLVYSVYST